MQDDRAPPPAGDCVIVAVCNPPCFSVSVSAWIVCTLMWDSVMRLLHITDARYPTQACTRARTCTGCRTFFKICGRRTQCTCVCVLVRTHENSLALVCAHVCSCAHACLHPYGILRHGQNKIKSPVHLVVSMHQVESVSLLQTVCANPGAFPCNNRQ